MAEVEDAVVEVGELWIDEPVGPLVCVAIERAEEVVKSP